ncbi:copper amine oxidase N-terminal domain-containing protein [Candidatus Saccharibacteria bacterium]|nr:copper amine oxidase N-terminal domain-containing protein [Candidatus Saccharibacteria bacterium]
MATKGSGALDVNAYDGVRTILLTQPQDLLDFDRFEAVIIGSGLEFYGQAVLVYNTGQRSAAHDVVHEVFSDGERITLFIDHSLGTQVEMYVQFRIVSSASDTILYSLPIRPDGRRGSPASSPLFSAEANVLSTYRPSRSGTGSVLDIFTSSIGTTGDLRDRMGFRAGNMSDIRTTLAVRPDANPEPAPIEAMPLSYIPSATTIVLTIGSTAYTINGVLHQADAAPFIASSRTMVPLRLIAEALGAEVSWDGATQTVTIAKGNVSLSLVVGVPLPGDMGTPALVGDRTFVPLAYVAQALGAAASWDGNAQAVTIVGVT